MMTYKNLEKKRNFITNNTIKCKCGHSLFFQRDMMICTWCGRFVFKNKQEEFKHTLHRLIIQKNRMINDD